MITGSIPALLTPFKAGEIDWPSFDRMVERQIENGSHGLLACGSTGEAFMLRRSEFLKVIRRTIEIADGRVPVIGGSSAIATWEAVELTQEVERLGATAALIVAPPYVRPSQEAIFQHFKAIHDQTNIPIIVYNNPARTVCLVEVETSIRLAHLERVIAEKDATGDLARPARILKETKPEFAMLTGEDGNAYEFNEQGGQGCISVVANIAPALSAELWNTYAIGDLKKSKEIAQKLKPLNNVLFCEGNPVTPKCAAQILGLCSDEVRLPLVPATDNARQKLTDVLSQMGMLSEESPKQYGRQK